LLFVFACCACTDAAEVTAAITMAIWSSVRASVRSINKILVAIFTMCRPDQIENATHHSHNFSLCLHFVISEKLKDKYRELPNDEAKEAFAAAFVAEQIKQNRRFVREVDKTNRFELVPVKDAIDKVKSELNKTFCTIASTTRKLICTIKYLQQKRTCFFSFCLFAPPVFIVKKKNPNNRMPANEDDVE
jgi:hypothetical protein